MRKNNSFDEEDIFVRLDNENYLKNLNLYNFENNEAASSPYILTSPRSLKACRLANIKPIELLHRSVEEIIKDLNFSDDDEVNHIYHDYEHERLRKLEICKLIRKHIITSEANYNEEISSQSSTNVFLNTDVETKFCSSSENTSDLFHSLKRSQSFSSCSNSFTPMSQYNFLRKQKNKILNYGLPKSDSFVSLNSITKDNKKIEKPPSVMFRDYKNINLKKTLKRNLPNIKKSADKKKVVNKVYVVTKNQINDQQLCWQIDKVKNLENNSKENIQVDQKSKKGLPEAKKKLEDNHNTNEQNNIIKNCEKILLNRREPPKKQSLTKNNMKSLIKIRQSGHQTKRLNDKYNKNIKTETNHNESRETIEFIPKNTDNLKNHNSQVTDTVELKKKIQQSHENLVRRAKQIWEKNENELTEKKYVCSKKLNNEKKRSIGKKLNCNTYSKINAYDEYYQQAKDRIKKLKATSLYKELHSEHVRQLARELHIGMEQWQDQVLVLQWQALQRARTNAKLYLENKRLKTQSENNERALLHALRFRNIQDMERIRQQIMKKEIKEKDFRIQKFKAEREREILDCRAQAYYTAELREQLRRTLTPDTFDRKVNDALIKSRFINRSLTASPFIESHIRLG